MPRGLKLELVCDTCGEHHPPLKPMLSLTRMSVLRVQAGTALWYVDGGQVLCANCRPPFTPDSPQRVSWSEADREHVLRDLTPEPLTTCSICNQSWDQAHRDGECPESPIRRFV